MRSASPGSQHSGAAGSEYADGLAKEAAEGSLPYNILDEVRWLWTGEATGAVLEFLEDTREGCRVSSGEVKASLLPPVFSL